MPSNFLNGVIRFSLRQRVLVAALAAFRLSTGAGRFSSCRSTCFRTSTGPALSITEAPGLAPEEVEPLITFPSRRP